MLLSKYTFQHKNYEQTGWNYWVRVSFVDCWVYPIQNTDIEKTIINIDRSRDTPDYTSMDIVHMLVIICEIIIHNSIPDIPAIVYPSTTS